MITQHIDYSLLTRHSTTEAEWIEFEKEQAYLRMREQRRLAGTESGKARKAKALSENSPTTVERPFNERLNENEQTQAFENLVKEQKEAKEMTTVKEAKDVILGEIPKGDKEKVVVSLKEYQGHRYADVRIHFKTDTGMWQFTKKGITLNPAKVKDLVLMLQKVKA